MRKLLTFALLLAAPAFATSALAQVRAPPERQALTDLAYALGESHALRQLCNGPNDQYWRDRMVRLTQVEDADSGFDAALRERFNTGYAAGQATAVACGPASRRAEAAAASRGQALARRLASVTHAPAPPPPDYDEAR
jgi:uncharacterized protein (TIGR02301 family)